jgi:glucose-6-phosphate 1-epimerase
MTLVGKITGSTQEVHVNRFDIPNAIRFETGSGGLARAIVATPAVDGELYLQGAHVTHWAPRGQRPALFVSSKSHFAPGTAIRGGVPVIFPWFGPRSDGKAGPAHGFARTLGWTVEDTRLLDRDRVEITLSLAPNDTTRDFGYADFHLWLRVIFGAELEMELETRNEAQAPLTYEEALHTYFAIGDIHQVTVSGLEGTTYIDKTDGFRRKQQGNQPIRIAKETDQLHLSTSATCVIHDPAWNRRMVVEKGGSNSTVVWNPWIEKTRSLGDMVPDDWEQMICVETVNAADNAVHLTAGSSHKMTAAIRLA